MNDMNTFPSYRVIRWALLLVMAFTVPVFYFMFVVAGFLPLSGLIGSAIRDLRFPVIAVPIMEWLEVAAYGALLFFLSGKVAKQICLRAGKRRLLWVAVVLGSLIGIGLLPIYGASHGTIHPKNAFTILVKLWAPEPV